MARADLKTFTAFEGETRLEAGALASVARAAKIADDRGASRLLVLDDTTGRPIELDLRGSVDDVVSRLDAGEPETTKPPTRGRPKLGVTAREVTLLPAHWDWLAGQPGGASAALRRLVDQARRSGQDDVRLAKEAAYRVMSSLAGNALDFEEATRAFFAGDYDRFYDLTTPWPKDVADYVRTFVERVANYPPRRAADASFAQSVTVAPAR